MHLKTIIGLFCMLVGTTVVQSITVEETFKTGGTTVDGQKVGYNIENQEEEEKLISALEDGEIDVKERLKNVDTSDFDSASEEKIKELYSKSSEAARLYQQVTVYKKPPKLQASSSIPRWGVRRYDVCPERIGRVLYIWEIYRKRICKVIKPQYITYARCTYKPCCNIFTNIRSICLPKSWVYHKFLVLCYNLDPRNRDFKWELRSRWYPKCCDCHYW